MQHHWSIIQLVYSLLNTIQLSSLSLIAPILLFHLWNQTHGPLDLNPQILLDCLVHLAFLFSKLKAFLGYTYLVTFIGNRLLFIFKNLLAEISQGIFLFNLFSLSRQMSFPKFLLVFYLNIYVDFENLLYPLLIDSIFVFHLLCHAINFIFDLFFFVLILVLMLFKMFCLNLMHIPFTAFLKY